MTYELKNPKPEDRDSLRRRFGHLIQLENLGLVQSNRYWNVSCEDEEADDVLEFLEQSAIEHRSV